MSNTAAVKPAPAARSGCTFSAVALVIVLIFLLICITILARWWDEFLAWSNPYGNAAGVIGLAVSVVGFFLTLLTMWDTRRINSAAEARIEIAVQDAQEAVQLANQQTRMALERIAVILLVSEVETLCRYVLSVRDSGQAAQWERAAFQCQEATLLVPHLLGQPKPVA